MSFQSQFICHRRPPSSSVCQRNFACCSLIRSRSVWRCFRRRNSASSRTLRALRGPRKLRGVVCTLRIIKIDDFPQLEEPIFSLFHPFFVWLSSKYSFTSTNLKWFARPLLSLLCKRRLAASAAACLRASISGVVTLLDRWLCWVVWNHENSLEANVGETNQIRAYYPLCDINPLSQESRGSGVGTSVYLKWKLEEL